MTDAWTQTMDPNAWICMNCGKRRVDGVFPDYVCPGSWNGGVCEPRPVREQCPSELLGRCFLDAGHHGDHRGPEPFNAKWSDTKPGQLIGPPLFAERPITQSEVVVSRTDLEWAIMWIALSPPDAEKLPEARAAYNRLAATLFDEAGEA